MGLLRSITKKSINFNLRLKLIIINKKDKKIHKYTLQTYAIGSLLIQCQCITECYPAESMYLQPFYTTEKLLPNRNFYTSTSTFAENLTKISCGTNLFKHTYIHTYNEVISRPSWSS